ncbi:MAG: hypothetical protein ACLVGX_01345, partial [Oscillospiraceae bacterium]
MKAAPFRASIIHGRRVLCKHTKSGVEICGKFRLRTHKKCGSMYQIQDRQKTCPAESFGGKD